MKRNLIARAIVICLLALCVAAYVYHDIYKMRRLGRDRFLAEQAVDAASRFDSTASTPAPIVVSVFGAIFVIFPLFLFYELLVLVVAKVLKAASIGVDDVAPAPGPQLPFS